MKNLIMCTLLGVSAVFGQSKNTATHQTKNISPSALVTGESLTEAIEDNSFFIEEAFNQEERVVQHISSASYFKSPERSFLYTFTQEWPISSQKHQLSYSVPYEFIGGGIGDILLNYRLQVLDKENWAAFAPRFSIILPTGDANKELGNGVLGLQVNLPLSKRVSNSLIVHFNAGSTLLPGVKQTLASGDEVKKNLLWYNVGGGVIWLAHKNFNILLEYVRNVTSDIDEQGEVVSDVESIINPGIRYAIDIGDLQIVPGIAFPFSVTSSSTRIGSFFYLSFEHPF